MLPVRDIERVLYPLLGDHKTLADVQAARAALEDAYHKHGYRTVFVDIPPQDVTAEAIVRLKVTEGRLNERTISGARFFSERQILSNLPATTPGTVPQFAAVQQQIAAVNQQSADRAVVPIMKAGSVPGTVDLALRVDDHLPLHGSLELDNQNTPDTTPLRGIAALSYDDLFGELDSLGVQYQFSPEDIKQIKVWEASFTSHPLADGLRPTLYYVDSASSVATLGTLGVLGKGQIIGTRLTWPLPDTVAQSLMWGIDYKDFRNTISLTGGVADVTPISYVNAVMGYAGSWRDADRTGSLSVSANFGPRGLANGAEDFANDRYQGRANYFYVRADASFEQKLPAGFGLLLRVGGQYAFEPLISNEAYSIAGADGVRGYLEVEELGDKAVKGTAQLELPSLVVHRTEFADGFLFFDSGVADTLEALSGQLDHVDLASWGAGLSLLPGRRVSGTVTFARTLLSGSRTPAGDSKVLFDVRGSF